MKVLIEQIPSVYKENDISTSIKPIEREKANVEIEKDEIVLKPDFTAIHKAGGKKHGSGGTPALLEPNSFIFSDDKSLAFTKKDYELFELKKGGSMAATKNTPAEVVKRNIDLKHYNKMSSTLTNNAKDDIAKTTAALMLNKYLEKLGQIAFVQEDKKEFPQGVPEFSEGTAPVYEDEVKSNIEENMQYMKYGGTKRYDTGGQYKWIGDKLYRMASDTGSVFAPQGRRINSAMYPVDPNSAEYQQQLGSRNASYDPWSPLIPPAFQGTGMPIARGENNWIDRVEPPKEQNYNYMYPGFSNNFPVLKMPADTPKPPQQAAAPNTTKSNTDGTQKSTANPAQVANTTPDLTTVPLFRTKIDRVRTPLDGKSTTPTIPKNAEQMLLAKVAGAKGIEGEQEQPFALQSDINWMDKANIANALFNTLNVNRYTPMRSQIKTGLTNLEKQDVNPALTDISQAYNSAISGIKTLNPYLAAAQANMMYGRNLDAIRQTRAQYEAQNTQISNQEAMINQQTLAQDAGRNATFDQQYYRESIEAAKNFDNMRSFNRNRAFEVTTQAYANAMQADAMNMQLGPNAAYYFDYENMRVTPNPNRNIFATQSGSDVNSKYIDMLTEIVNKQTTSDKDKISAISRMEALSKMKKKGGFSRGSRY
jgi:hypothetical protein